MDITEHTHPDKLEKYSFLWSELRLLIAAVALFIGGVPPILFLIRVPFLYGIIGTLLTLCWIVSGLASGYLLYRWFTGGKRVFGTNDWKDTTAFFVSVISGFNLGIAGLSGSNIGMAISSNSILFIIVGMLYLVSAWYLFKRWKESGKKLFSNF